MRFGTREYRKAQRKLLEQELAEAKAHVKENSCKACYDWVPIIEAELARLNSYNPPCEHK